MSNALKHNSQTKYLQFSLHNTFILFARSVDHLLNYDIPEKHDWYLMANMPIWLVQLVFVVISVYFYSFYCLGFQYQIILSKSRVHHNPDLLNPMTRQNDKKDN